MESLVLLLVLHFAFYIAVISKLMAILRVIFCQFRRQTAYIDSTISSLTGMQILSSLFTEESLIFPKDTKVAKIIKQLKYIFASSGTIDIPPSTFKIPLIVSQFLPLLKLYNKTISN